MRIITYTIKLFCIYSLLLCNAIHAQNDSIAKQKPDSLKQKYGLRFGTDVIKLIRSAAEDNYKGFEIATDFRISKRIFIAAEFGNEKRTLTTNYLDNTTNGNYYKLGADYNLYKNWYGMQNLIFAGLRVGHSTFSQTRNSYGVYSQNEYWETQYLNTEVTQFSNLSATWLELIFGIKAELLTNVYFGLQVSIKNMLKQKQPQNYENLYVPGFARTYDSGKIGFGYGYTISYLIPLFKK